MFCTCRGSQQVIFVVLLLAFITYTIVFLQNGLLGAFQKLIASKANDHEGFYLLNSIIQHMPK